MATKRDYYEVLGVSRDASQEEIKKARKEKLDYSRLIKYYKRKLVDYGVMKQIRGYVSENKYTKVKVTNLNNVSA